MKQFSWIIIAVIFCALTLPALAQRGGRPPRPGGGAPPTMGRVLEVTGKQAKLALYIKADSPDAPGKMPDEFAAIAARLENQANELERNGKKELVRKMREQIQEFRCMREVEATIDEKTPLVKVVSTPLDQVANGTRLAMEVSAEGVAGAETPTRVTLVGDVRQVGPAVPAEFTRYPRGKQGERVFFRLVGEVVSANPLRLNVNGTEIEVVNPRQSNYKSAVTIPLRELKVSQRLYARVIVGEKLTIDRVRGVIITDIKNPNEVDGLLEI